MRSDVIKAAAFLVVLIFLPGAVGPTSAPTRATLTVNTTIDASDGDTDDGVCDTGNADEGFTGLCTLRAAWQTADDSPAADVIVFDLGAGIPTITLGSGLGDMTSTIDINGATGGATKVEIKGPGAGPGPGSDSGMLITAGGNSIKNLIMNSFDGSALILSTEGGSTLEGNWIGIDQTGASAPNATAGLLLDGSSGNMIGGTTEATRNVLDGVIFLDADANTFTGNYVGTTPDGSAATGTGGGLAFVFGAEDNVIGGLDPGAGNVISGNTGNGIGIGFGSTGNLIEGNFIGTNPTGSVALGNNADGIHIIGSSENVIIGNLISGNGSDGIELREGGAQTMIAGNRIGTDMTGTTDLGNSENGIHLHAAPENLIGGPDAADRNVISGNGLHGIYVFSVVPEAPFPNVIGGNFIGTNATGTAALANGGYGVAFEATSMHFLGSPMGGARPACTGACNLIAGNGMGGVGLLRGAMGVLVRHNVIGLTADGTAPLPNTGPGINIVGANDNRMEGNVIAFNGGPGVRLVESASPMMSANHNALLGNMIFENVGLGIDLNGDGPTPNNLNISTGPNELQAYPVLTSVTFDGTMTTVKGFLQSDASEMHTIEFFANAATDPSNFGEGEMLVSTLAVTTDGDGRAAFDKMLPGEVLNVTTTATDDEGNTSEFSRIAGGLIVNDVRDLPDLDLTDGLCDASEEEGNQCTLRAAIQTANSNTGERDEIQFGISDGTIPTIRPVEALPAITDPVVIDGTTQNANVRCFPQFLPVEIDGAQAGAVDGLTVAAGGAGSLIKGLTINRFAGSGIVLNSNDNTVACNFIGTDSVGRQARPNQTGIAINGTGNVVGGADFTRSNVISGNRRYGVWIQGGSGNRVEGNFIGPDVTGNAALQEGDLLTGNGWDGVFIDDGAAGNTIGGVASAPGQPPGNILSNNGVIPPNITSPTDPVIGNGIHIAGDGNMVQGNRIGQQHGGDAGLQNGTHGVYLYGGSANNRIGGTAAGSRNTIVHNFGAGVRIAPSATEAPVGNTIRGNTISQNGTLGIDLGDLAEVGVTPNDAGDGDAGANDLLNFPVITEISRVAPGGDVVLDVTVDAPLSGGSTATVEFFANEGCDDSGHGEGAVSLGTREVSSGSGGPAVFEHTLSGLPLCRFITATLTDIGGSTSEFSQCQVVRSECLEITEVQFWHEPPGADAPFETSRTTDGNPVEIRTLVQNKAQSPVSAEVRINEEIGGHMLLPETQTVSFPANQTTTLRHPWNTTGFAWESDSDFSRPQSARRVRVQLFDPLPPSVPLIDERSTDVTVKPRPVVLAHGLWSRHETWTTFKGFLDGVRTDWPHGAVGDGAHPGLMNMGVNPGTAIKNSVDDGPFALSLIHTTTTIAQNAGELRNYIESIRADEEAAHIDLVAHSMGGLISRYYIDELMPDAPGDDPAPVVSHLVMLGTPNLGSPCADAYLWLLSQPRKFLTGYARRIPLVGSRITAWLNEAGEALERTAATNLYQLTPEYVRGTFNRDIINQRGVPFSIARGRFLDFTCHALNPGDGVVEVTSAFAEGSTPVPFFDLKHENTLDHTDMTGNEADAFSFARRILDTHPGEVPASKKADASTSFATAAAQTEEPQFIASSFIPVPPGDPLPVTLPVRQATTVGVTLIGVDNLTSALIDPMGMTTSQTNGGTPEAAVPFRVHAAQNPAPGAWTVTLSHSSPTDTLYVLMNAWTYGDVLRLGMDIGTPLADGNILLNATLTDGGTPISDAEVAARLLPDRDGVDILEIDLFDDGAHDDGAAGDGVYGGQTGALPAASYTVGVWAARGDDLRGTYQIVEITNGGTPNGANLAVDLTATPEATSVGEPVTYTAILTNNGPANATGVVLTQNVPSSITLGPMMPLQGTCAVADDLVTCDLGDLASGNQATVTYIATPNVAGLLINTVAVTATESDWNASNNTASVLTMVGTATATEDETGVPRTFALHPNFPNPFNPQTTIRFDIAQATPVRLRVFNAMGQQVATLVEGTYAPGTHEVTFDASALPSGVYVYRIEAGAFQAMRTMVLLK